MHGTTRQDLGLTDASCACGTHSHTTAVNAATPNEESPNTFQVTGMTCSHCVASVTKELGKLAGPENVTVSLVPGGVSVVTVAGATLDRSAVAAAIDEAGYELVAETR
ncbi:heavy-metal-associated domain-containing protein [Cryobacterium sp. PH31-AA6]|uniref:heavy-metal-associated domain-containing protein n=1 Tax=Cryobacterium sp. PH31-AA6 TaxID=3046205 RepID=UPI0024BA4342|nr:heavy-metal-associated domain-containing protein [Cryobacterium sp. PH31-AA6]MDJ0324703.1 heavy-metal-associated domain-containing protein [Cryobacterium sp. PH31-AA6]